MNRKDSTEGAVYKITALFIFVLLIAFIALITVSTALSKGDSDVPSTPVETKPVQLPVTEELTVTAPVTDTDAPAEADETEPETEPETVSETEPETKAPDRLPDTPVSAPEANTGKELAEFLAGFPDTVLPLTEDAGREYIDKLTFLGDSTTYGLRHYEMLEGGKKTMQVWTPDSGTLTLSSASFATIVYPETGEPLTIKAAVEKKKPEYLVITLGVNGISFMDEDYFKSEYKKVIESVKEASPDTKIICQSMFPVARSYAKLESINNEKIQRGNRWIVEVAAETGVKFVDTYSVLADSEGWLPESYHNGDGMHLQTVSFTKELDNLRTHAYE